MSTERFDELTAPPVEGQFYRVWCVRGTWEGYKGRWWPIWGPKHEDAKWINFEPIHWHLNRFFLPGKHQWKSTGSPFHGGAITENEPLPAPVLHRIKCLTAEPMEFPARMVADRKNWRDMYTHYAGQQCKRGNGWICPHKGFDLGPMRPGADGHIQCPLHGILVNAETGVVASFGAR